MRAIAISQNVKAKKKKKKQRAQLGRVRHVHEWRVIYLYLFDY